MPTPLAEILAEADALLQPDRFEDYGPNGLQVPGDEQVEDARHRSLGGHRSI